MLSVFENYDRATLEVTEVEIVYGLFVLLEWIFFSSQEYSSAFFVDISP